MKFEFCVYAFSTDQGSGIQVFDDLTEGLEAYREDLARHHDYAGPADLESIEDWRETNPREPFLPFT